jgi:addiction module RelB/DinJ family antitoxin
MAQKSIQVRIDEDLKKRVEKILADMGLDIPTAIRIYFMKMADTESIPFALGKDAGPEYTPEQIAKLDRMAEEAILPGNSFGPFDSVAEMFEHMKQQKI